MNSNYENNLYHYSYPSWPISNEDLLVNLISIKDEMSNMQRDISSDFSISSHCIKI